MNWSNIFLAFRIHPRHAVPQKIPPTLNPLLPSSTSTAMTGPRHAGYVKKLMCLSPVYKINKWASIKILLVTTFRTDRPNVFVHPQLPLESLSFSQSPTHPQIYPCFVVLNWRNSINIYSNYSFLIANSKQTDYDEEGRSCGGNDNIIWILAL